jgi:hypothetical protein
VRSLTTAQSSSADCLRPSRRFVRTWHGRHLLKRVIDFHHAREVGQVEAPSDVASFRPIVRAASGTDDEALAHGLWLDEATADIFPVELVWAVPQYLFQRTLPILRLGRYVTDIPERIERFAARPDFRGYGFRVQCLDR